MTVFKYNVSKLERRRLEKGWTQTQLAKEASLSRVTVCQILNGRKGSPETIKKLAAALGVELASLVVATEEVSA